MPLRKYQVMRINTCTTHVNSEVDGELCPAALNGPVWHRPHKIRQFRSYILLFVLARHQKSVGGATFLCKLKTRGVYIWF